MIKFFKGLREKYNSELHGLGIYFATDTGEIIHGGKSYSGLLAVGKVVSNITLEGGVMTIAYNDGSTQEVEIGSGKYQSGIEDESLGMPNAVGGIAKGTTVGNLSGKTYDELFDDLLFPTMNPTHSDPSVSGFLLTSNGPVELGTSVISVSEATLNKGKWNEYNNNAPYAGDVTSINYTFTINGATYAEISDLVGKTYNVLGNHSYKAVVNYAAGETPKNNKGVEVASLACPAGSKSAERTVNVTAPWYATTEVAGVLTKQALISWNSTAGNMVAGGTTGFDLMPHTADAPQMFKTPRQVTIAAGRLLMYNTVAKAFENVSITEWEETVSTESINGVDQTYYTYTYKGANRGSVKLIVKF